MKALRYHGRRDIRLEEVPTPVPGPGQVRVRVTDAGLSQTQIGEFMEGPFIISAGTHPLTGFSGPIIPCQEFGGVVDEVGAGADRALMGSQVAVLPLISCGSCPGCAAGRPNICERLAYRGLLGADGGFCEYTVVGHQELFPVADPVLANFVEPLLVGVHAAKRLRGEPTGQVLVVGAGAVGCALAAVWADCLGRDVVVHDLLPQRLHRAAEMGLTTLAQRPQPGSYEVVVDAAGKDVVHDVDALLDAMQWCRPGGTVMSIGTYFSPLTFTPSALTLAERDLVSSFAYDHSDVADLATWIGKLTVDFSALTTVVPLERLVEDGYYQAEIDKDTFTRIVTCRDG